MTSAIIYTATVPRSTQMALKKIEHAAPKKQFLTLDEIDAWVQDARRSGARGDEIASAAVSFGGKLQKIGVEVEVPPADWPSLDKEQ